MSGIPRYFLTSDIKTDQYGTPRSIWSIFDRNVGSNERIAAAYMVSVAERIIDLLNQHDRPVR